MGSANERRPYYVTPSLIGWAHAQNGPCTWGFYRRSVRLSGPIQDWWALRRKNAGPRLAATPARDICLQVVHQYRQWCMGGALLHIRTRRPGKRWLETWWGWWCWIVCPESYGGAYIVAYHLNNQLCHYQCRIGHWCIMDWAIPHISITQNWVKILKTIEIYPLCKRNQNLQKIP